MVFTLAIPSKGRLKEKAAQAFEAAGLTIEQPEDARSYQGSLTGLKNGQAIDIAFLSASEIARELVNGTIHAGITGEDLARETVHAADQHLDFALKLDFGHADVVLAVPQTWYDVEAMADLDDVAADFRARHGRRLRIATKYWRLTQQFLSGHGIALYRITESLGATEAAPAAGQADAIVDITSTGSTLQANGLKVLADSVILRSQANLIVSRHVQLTPEQKQGIDQVCDLLRNVVQA